MARLLILAVSIVFGLSFGNAVAQDSRVPVRRVIVLVGDGMGVSQITLGRMANGKPLHLDKFPTSGLVTVHSADRLVTDSAAAATALGTGSKTVNRRIGLDADGKRLKTLWEQLKERGWFGGFVTNTRITHATPAGFYAHVKERSMEKEIAWQLLESAPDLALGGGARSFSIELLDRFKAKGYSVATTKEQLKKAKGKVLGLFSKSHLPYEIDGPTDGPTLGDLADRALQDLAETKQPFFLMIEGGRIDHAGHNHDAPAAVKEMIAFDAIIGRCLDYAKKTPGTLVVVTADHATGGLGISERIDLDKLRRVRTSAGRLAKALMKAKDTEEARTTYRRMTGLEDLVDSDLWWIQLGYGTAFPSARTGHLVSGRLGIYFFPPGDQERGMTVTDGHNGAMVPVYGFGPGASRFSGTLDNTDIPKRIMELVDRDSDDSDDKGF